MDFLDYLNLNKQIEIINNKIYERYYLNNSYADPNNYPYKIEDAGNILGKKKFNVIEGNEIYGLIHHEFTDYQLVPDYDFSGDTRGYKVVKGIDENEVGYLLKKYGDSSKVYYQYYPVKAESTKEKATSSSQSSDSSNTSSYSSSSNSSGDSSGNLDWMLGFLSASILPIIGTIIAIYNITDNGSYKCKSTFFISYWVGVIFVICYTGFCLVMVDTPKSSQDGRDIFILTCIWLANSILNFILGIIWKGKR